MAGPSYFNGSVVGKLGFSVPIGRASSNKKNDDKKLEQQLEQLQSLTEEIATLKRKINDLQGEQQSTNSPTATSSSTGNPTYASLLEQLKRAKQSEAELITSIKSSQEFLIKQQATIDQQAKQIEDHKQILVAQQKQINLLLQRLGISATSP